MEAAPESRPRYLCYIVLYLTQVGMLGTSYISYVILPLPSSSCMCMPSHRNTMCAVSLPLPARDGFLTSYCDGIISYVYGRRTRACRTVYYSTGRDLPTSQALYLLQ